MAYDFATLSHADFEDLTRDLIGRELGIRFEAFAAGPDGGIDGRHASSTGTTVLQAKHYVGSSYAALKSQMKRERAAIDQLCPARYILATSRPLSPPNKRELAKLIGSALWSETDIKSSRDLNSLLRDFPDIEKSHIKLWLSGTAMLERVLRSAANAFNDITKKEIETKVHIYAPNPSFNRAQETLEAHRVLIISGPPGVGKSTLAEIVSYTYVAEGWDLVAIRNLDDGLAAIDDTRKNVFFFDDFLGKVALDQRALSHRDSHLARFIRKIRASPNARFILTTRAYIFEEARRVSEYLADPALDVSKYVLDVGVYTRQIKARILYNHLVAARVEHSHVVALIKSGNLPKVIDHKNYNPRIIEWMTDAVHVGMLASEAYPPAFLYALDHPSRLWDIAFRTHIARRCQHLLVALFFSYESGVEIDDLRVSFEGLHTHLCAEYGEVRAPKDFEDALRILEGGFIALRGSVVSFVNPSLRDYLMEYLDDLLLLRHAAVAACEARWAQSVWEHRKRLDISSDDLESLARAFLSVAKQFPKLSIWQRGEDGSLFSRYTHGLSNTDRIELLISWWEASKEQRFADIALTLARTPSDGLDCWRDGDSAVELIGRLRGGYFGELPLAEEMADGLEIAFIKMLENGMPLEHLERISDSVELWGSRGRIADAVNEAINHEFYDVRNVVAEIDSESTLEEHMKSLKKLAERAGTISKEIELAIAIVNERIVELEERTPPPKPTSIRAATPSDSDDFDDVALTNLFAPLVERM